MDIETLINSQHFREWLKENIEDEYIGPGWWCQPNSLIKAIRKYRSIYECAVDNEYVRWKEDSS